MTSGRHHAWSCPRYSYSDAGECKFCGFVGEVSLVKSSGPHHVRNCPRFGRGTADSPKVVVCRYCGFRGSAALVTGMGDQHLVSCPRSTRRQPAKKEKPTETEGASWSLLGMFGCLAADGCCNVDTTSSDASEIVPGKDDVGEIKNVEEDLGEAETNIDEAPLETEQVV